jgi:hypothetical protein
MIDYSGHVVTTTRPLVGHINHLVIHLLSSLTTDQADVTNDENFMMSWHLMFRYLALRLALMGKFSCARPRPLTLKP